MAEFPAKIMREEGPCASEIAYKIFRDRLSRMMSRIAIYGSIGDYADDTPLIQELLGD